MRRHWNNAFFLNVSASCRSVQERTDRVHCLKKESRKERKQRSSVRIRARCPQEVDHSIPYILIFHSEPEETDDLLL